MGKVVGVVFSDYKCLRTVEVSPLSSLTVLAGKNSAGKSSVIDMVQRLPATVTGVGPKLPDETHPPSNPARVTITTEILWEEYPQYITMILQAHNMALPNREATKDTVRSLWETGLLRYVRWHMMGRPSLRLEQLDMSWIDGHRKGAVIWQGNRVAPESAELPDLSGIADCLRMSSPNRVSDAIRENTGTMQMSLKGKPSMGANYAGLLGHEKALAQFLELPRFRLHAQRKGLLSAAARGIDALASDGSNLAQVCSVENPSVESGIVPMQRL